MAGSEKYAQMLATRRGKLELAEAALNRWRAGKTTDTDRLRYRTLRELQEYVTHERACVEIAATY